MMHVRGGSPVLWCAPGCTRVGTVPGAAYEVHDLSPAEQHLLDALPTIHDNGDLYRRARATGVEPPRARRLVRSLMSTGVLKEGPAPAEADGLYWERLAVDPAVRSQALAQAVVGLVGAGALAESTARLLAEAGLGTILASEPHLGSQLDRSDSAVWTRVPVGREPDVVITLEPYVVDPVRARSLGVARVRHLPVVIGELMVRVGPLLDPSTPLCASCLGLWETEADPTWPACATQLRLAPEPVLERLLEHQAAGLVARAALDLLTDRGAWLGSHSVEISALEPTALLRQWDPHPACSCHPGHTNLALSPQSDPSPHPSPPPGPQHRTPEA